MISHTIEKPLAAWRGSDRYRGEVRDSLTVILRTGGCSWNRCRMCSYRHERYGAVSPDELERRLIGQIGWVMHEFAPESYDLVKIFTSGSFFDETEVPPGVVVAAAEAFRGKVVIAETRPQYVDAERLAAFREALDDGTDRSALYVAMGLETSNDFIREKCIDKGFSFADFREAARTAKRAGAGVKTYLLMKPPFLTEREAIDDMVSSIRDAAPLSDLISMNLCTVQSATEVEYFWKRRAYRPPYLWSALEVLAGAPVTVLCDPVGGGAIRGPHNCGRCDRELVRAINHHSLHDDRELLRALLERGCDCMGEWRYVLQAEKPYCMPLTR